MSISALRDPSLRSTAAAVTETPAAASTPNDRPSPFAQLLGHLGREVQSGEATMHAALGAAGAARDLGPAELIALQAGVYRYSEAVDLAAKLVDRATSGIKTIVQGNGSG